jgi:DNA-binding NtrC family response regulator
VQPADCLELGKIRLPENRLPLEHLEQEIVGKALKKFEGNKTRVAEYLGLSRSALRSRLKKL